jgi:hypothetical protein
MIFPIYPIHHNYGEHQIKDLIGAIGIIIELFCTVRYAPMLREGNGTKQRPSQKKLFLIGILSNCGNGWLLSAAMNECKK